MVSRICIKPRFGTEPFRHKLFKEALFKVSSDRGRFLGGILDVKVAHRLIAGCKHV
jgi:hypothetical protein